MAALTIGKDRTAVVLRRLAKSESDARVSRRMLAIANLSGMDRKAAAEAAGMDRQALRDWVIRYNAQGLEGLRDRWGKGRPGRLEPHEQAELAQIILRGPDPEADGISAYTLEDLVRITQARFGKPFHPASMSRVVRRLGFSRQKARPSHPKKGPAEAEAFKKSPGTAEKTSVYAYRQAHTPVFPGVRRAGSAFRSHLCSRSCSQGQEENCFLEQSQARRWQHRFVDGASS